MAVDVSLDSANVTKTLSYLLPAGWLAHIGDGVKVPLAETWSTGIIVALRSDRGKATKEITAILGPRAHANDIALAQAVARHHFVPLDSVLRRLGPPAAAQAPPLLEEQVKPAHFAAPALPAATSSRRLILRGPLHSAAALAAEEAVRIASKGQVLVLCPTTSLVDQVLARFEAGAARLDSLATPSAWAGFRTGDVRIGVGSRTAALAPAGDLAGVIVVDEDHPGHQEVRQPCTHARDLASARTRSTGLELVLISPAPTAQALQATTSLDLPLSTPAWPQVTFIDRNKEDPGTLIPPVMSAAISRAQKAGLPIVVIASSTKAYRRCYKCYTPRPCELCAEDTCKHPVSPCPKCSSTRIRVSGWDPKRLSTVFPRGCKVVPAGKLPYPGSSHLVILFDIDAALFRPELSPQRVAVRQLLDAAALAGKQGELVVGTSFPGTEVFRELQTGKGLLPWSQRGLLEARDNSLPPFGRMITVRMQRKTRPSVVDWPGIVSTPRRDKDVWEILVRIPAGQLLELEPFLLKLRKGGKASIKVE